MMIPQQQRPSILLTMTVACAAAGLAATGAAQRSDDGWPSVDRVERQPLVAATRRLVEAMRFVGAPLGDADRRALEAAYDRAPRACAETIQRILDRYCVAGVQINDESRVSVFEGPAPKKLVHNGWRTFLVKVHNQAGVTAKLRASSPNAAPLYLKGRGARQRPMTEQKLVEPTDVPHRFLDLAMADDRPLKARLSGLELEYRIAQLYSREVGRREVQLAFDVGQGTQDIGFRNAVPILFTVEPAVEVVLGVRDVDGSPTTACFVIRDARGRIYPNPARRLAPDFFFHDQVYRSDGESVALPAGKYSFHVSRGPEYVAERRAVVVREGVASQRVDFELTRWIHARKRGWYSGDHHVHAAGCAHYDSPTEGVGPRDMMRHILGEDLNVGCVLSWGPCWYTQKQHFEGKTSAISLPNYLMRYDVEVSGFPSSHAGHLCLLRLREDDYPETTKIEEWPSWTLPVLQWGKSQGAVVGYSHSGWGLALPDYDARGRRVPNPTHKRGVPFGTRAADTLPDYAMPPFDGIGANEFIVTVAHDACDFISAVDTPAIWELNIWYHTLNCGFRARISGETDFPCIYGERVGLGRVYVKLPPSRALDYDAWVIGVKHGRSYCGDGRSHVFDLKVGGVAVGEPGPRGVISQLDLAEPGKVEVGFDAAAMLSQRPTREAQRIRGRRLDQKPYWHIERARIGDTRKVPVELIVDGEPVARRELVADGETRAMRFDVDIERSSWVAVRILPSVHTNPVFVEVAGKPIRASKRSAEWCRKAVDVCWRAKRGRIGRHAQHRGEREQAKAAYDAAAAIYDRIIAESADR